MKTKKIILFLFLILSSGVVIADGFTSYVNRIKQDAKRQGYSSAVINQAFTNVQQLPRASYQNKHQTQVLHTFEMYQAITVTPARIALGKQKRLLYRNILAKISQQYQVPEQYLVALWGLETNYGEFTGSFPEFSALTTLAYESSRSKLFHEEIFAALTMLQDKKISLEKMQGSWAGAMGQSQFMPTAYLLFAVAYHHPGPADIWATMPDVFASIANYLQKEGWNNQYSLLFSVRLQKPISASLVGLRVKQPISFWLRHGIVAANGMSLSSQKGAYSLLLPAGKSAPAYLVNWNNFRVIMRWNASTFYAISVGDLANKIKG